MIHPAIMTTTRQVDYLNRTLDSLFESLFQPLAVVSDGPLPKKYHDFDGRIGFRSVDSVRVGITPTFRRALGWMSHREGLAVIFQDDVLAASDLRAVLSNLPEPRGIFSLYLSEGRSAPPGWNRLEEDGYPLNVGGCGFAMDQETARRLLDDPPFPRIDRLGSQLAMWARQNNVPFWLHSPSLLTHIGDVRVRGLCVISAALVSWRRQFHLPAILASLRACPLIDDVVVWQNEEPPSGEARAACERFGATLIPSPTNEFVYGRFLAMRQCRHPAVWTQDDDLIVHNIEEVAEAFEEAGGNKIAANLADDGHSRHWSVWQKVPRPFVELGFGSVVPASVCDVLDQWPHDPELRRRKADKIATIMTGWVALRAGTDALTRLFHEGRETGRDSNALWLRTDHRRLTEIAVARTLDWKSERESC